ncbi:YezD family protein [Clostridium aminobutyricum]|uniref:YezD family protein n=1 Tax=Clostridium aminobutyricum TaxID=33953 RepID=A0A939II61_CLOAM|nr:YezD family protein [Clostridium aminobutyricum]MBN7772243.1 YezD family protein [Clostridium aminobutyricum]
MTEKMNKKEDPIVKETLDKLLKVINEVHFGTVTLIIQEGKIVQIEKNEKIRLR